MWMDNGHKKEAFDNPPPYGSAEVAAPCAPPYPQHHVTVVQPAPPPTTVVIHMPSSFGSSSQRIRCPYCSTDISTALTYKQSLITYIVCLTLCLIGCWPCCLIPCCIDDCKDAEHNCPSCQRYLGNSGRRN